MITLAATLFVLGVLVFVHELGHFLAAKRSGIRVERFSLGFPPKMIGKKIGETEYMLSWLPLGGYVKMSGQDDFNPEPGSGKPWDFYSKSIPVRIFVIAAGPLTNFLFSFLLFWSIITFAGVQTITDMKVGDASSLNACVTAGIVSGDSILAVNAKPVHAWNEFYDALNESNETQKITFLKRSSMEKIEVALALSPDSIARKMIPFLKPKIGEVVPGSPAALAGLSKGDVVTKLDSTEILQWGALVSYIQTRPELPIAVSWIRNGTSMSASITPESQGGNDQVPMGRIGIRLSSERQRVGFIAAAGLAGKQTVRWTKEIFGFLGKLVTGKASMENLGGPIKIAQMAGQSAKYGVVSLLGFMAILSINLGVINILPLPMFDGGHIFQFVIEGITRKSLTFKQRAIIQYIGLAIILGLTLFVLINDIRGL